MTAERPASRADGRTAVAIMAKAPRPGQVKTRLCPPLSAEDAADLYHCFLQDKIEQVAAVPGARPVVAFTPVDGRPFFEAAALHGVEKLYRALRQDRRSNLSVSLRLGNGTWQDRVRSYVLSRHGAHRREGYRVGRKKS